MKVILSKLTKDQLIMLIASFGSDAAIARQLKCTRQMVHHLKKSLGIESSIKKKKSRNERILLDHQREMSGIDISNKYKISTSQSYRIIKKMEKEWKHSQKKKKLQTTLDF
jgi:DNA invertase Pin-like site-specific DNA recombinase